MSKIIKSSFAQLEEGQKRILSLRPFSKDFRYFEEGSTNEIINKTSNIQEVDEKAEEIIREAEKEAINILKNAENKLHEMMHQIEIEKQNWDTEKEHWIEMAKNEGYEEGLNLGKQDGFNEYKTFIDLAKETVSLSKQDYEKNVEQAEMTILHLGLKTAEKIIGFTLDVNPEAFMNLVKRVIKEVKDHQDVQIHVHPLYYDLLISQKEEIKAFFTNPITELYIIPDDELEQTDCVIESSFGRIDASIDTQLHEIKMKLIQILEGDLEDEGR
ncbi:flagellar assembly protein FliH [Schinkia sp. CFF1]